MSSRSLNKVMLIGNLTRDPNVRFTGNNTAVCSFGIATNRSWTPAEGGEKVEKTEFHNIVAWGKLADICGQLLHKGDKVYVDGRIQTRDWKTDDGQDRRITEVVIENMMLLSSRGGSGGYRQDDSSAVAPAGDQTAGDDQATAATDDAATPAADDTAATAEDTKDTGDDVADDIPF